MKWVGENGYVLTCRCDSFVLSASPLHYSEDYWQSPGLCFFNTYSFTSIFFELLPEEIFIPVTLMARQCAVNRPFAARYSWYKTPMLESKRWPVRRQTQKNTILN